MSFARRPAYVCVSFFAVWFLLSGTDVAVAQTVAINGVTTGSVTTTPGASITVAVSNGVGHVEDWIALSAVGSTEVTYLNWWYLSGTQTAPSQPITQTSFTITAPNLAGSYELRYFTRIPSPPSWPWQLKATSATIVVDGPPPTVKINNSTSSVTVTPAATVSVELLNVGGHVEDWIGLFALGATDQKYFNWWYLSGTRTAPSQPITQTSFTITVPHLTGTYEVRYFTRVPNPPSWLLKATSATIVVDGPPPTIKINNGTSSVTVSAGATVSVQLLNVGGHASDWVGLSAVGAAELTYLDWWWVDGTKSQPASPLASGSFSIAAPTAAGSYELRYFTVGTQQETWSRRATSATIVALAPVLTVNGASGALTVLPNETVTVGLTNGVGQVTDWIGLADVGAPDLTYRDWWYLNGTKTQPATGSTAASFSIVAPTIEANYELRYFTVGPNQSWSRRETSGTLTTEFRVTQPTFTVAGGTYQDDFNVIVANTTSGSTIHYTQNGSEPTQSDPIVASGSTIAITRSQTLNAKAFKAGIPSSAVGSVSYEMRASTPAFSPAPGTFTSPTSVTMTTTTTGATVRYTLDGSTPTAASTAYVSAIQIEHTMTLKAVASKPNWSDSSVNTSNYTMNFGTLSPPTASPAGGVYADAQSVTLSSISGATIRYTLDGSEPTAVSNLYVTPVQVSSGNVTIKSRAFHPDWTQSPVASRDYTIDAAAPTITSSRFPAAVAGWHNAPTTISFTCQDNVGIASCSSSITVSTEGNGQQIVGTAIDQAGRQATETVTVNLDSTAPTVVLTTPPGSVTTSNSSLELVGEVGDLLSGLAGATCDGQSASIVSGGVSCTVAIGPGRNDVMLGARDAAGNVTSKSVRVMRVGTSTAIGLTPTARTLLVDQSTTLKLTDEFGALLAAADWSSSDTSIVSVSTDDPPLLTALQPGTVTITAVKNGFTAQASLNVVTTLPLGSEWWSVTGAPGFSLSQTIAANRVDLDVPDMFSVESDGTTTNVRGITAAGGPLWVARSPGLPLMGDAFGGLVAGTWAPFDSVYGAYGDQVTSYVRFAAPAGRPGWRYDSAGRLTRPAQAPDGTIYAVERYSIGVNNSPQGTPILETQIVVFDGDTGAVRARYTLPRENGFTCHSGVNWQSPPTKGPIVGPDGYGYILIRESTVAVTGPCSEEANWSKRVGAKLLRVTPSGAVSSTTLHSQDCIGIWSDSICSQPPQLLEIFPDGIGGTLTRVHITTGVTPSGYTGETRLIRVAAGAIQLSTLTDFSERIYMIGDQGRAYLYGRAMDVTTWTPIWTNGSLEPVMAGPGGRVAMHDLNTGMLHEVDSTGAIVQSGAFGGRWGFQIAFGAWASAEGGALRSRIGLQFNEARESFTVLGGVGTSQNAPTERTFPTRELAALKALDHIYHTSATANAEYGGLICSRNNRFEWSEIKTNNNQSMVIVPDSLCPPGTLAARYHTHPGLESPIPSDPGDYDHANANPGKPNYLRTRKLGTPAVRWPPFPTQTLSWWKPPSGTSADQNVCVRQSAGWVPYVAGVPTSASAVCAPAVP